jgi:mRNA-degrading endonuclease RelE of RelBE toxin-antitoxin system
MKFEHLAEFDKDLKKLLKKYRSLLTDLNDVKAILKIRPNDKPPFSFRIDNLGIDTCVIKVKKIACDSLKGRGVNSGLRLIYAYFEAQQKIIFVELYHKSDKENEDKERIIQNFR